jgi:hypothetical protein
MGATSVYLTNQILGHVFGKATYSPPIIYVALSLTDPLVDGSGLSEPVGGSYARVATASSDWDTPSGAVIYNAASIQFPIATVSWGTIGWYAIMDSLTEGNLLSRGAVSPTVLVDVNNQFQFDIGDLSVPL